MFHSLDTLTGLQRKAPMGKRLVNAGIRRLRISPVQRLRACLKFMHHELYR
jgi:hypothetical protein